MKVKEAYQVLYALMADEYGEEELIAMDSRSGVTSSVSISSKISEIEEDYLYDTGTLCGRPAGFKYVGVYLNR